MRGFPGASTGPAGRRDGRPPVPYGTDTVSCGRTWHFRSIVVRPCRPGLPEPEISSLRRHAAAISTMC